jgi:hypothetical protein
LLVEAQDRNDALRLVGLKTNNLEPKFELELPLSSQVRTGSLYVGARIDGTEIIVRWRSIRRPFSAIPTREPADVTAGFARIDPSTGRLIAAVEGEPPVPLAAKFEIPAAVQKLADEGRLASPLCPVDNLVAALQYVEQNSTGHMILRRWRKDTGGSMPSAILFGNEFTFRNFTRACRHLLASKAVDGWVWHIYSTVTGEQTAEIHNPLPGPEFFVSGDKVIYQSPAGGESVAGRLRIDPPKLVALDLNSVKELWAQPIGETAYVGLYPSNPPDGAGRKRAQVRRPGIGPGGRKRPSKRVPVAALTRSPPLRPWHPAS